MEKVNLKNVVMCFQLSHNFKLKNLFKQSSSFVERCFTMMAKSPAFLELDFVLVENVLSSSNLDITSQLEVMNAAGAWKSYDKKRIKFVKDFLKVRLPLLSDPALKRV